ncbi:unnamed protein product [Cylicocyclus nassatus]|uniref:Peptidase C1A papain C-terminal domain-containing protein n=1 Tax=Cylicocyclus nassatus TaxID=53992 RepID=A0AA36GMK0_CYLNA|nr:unnamed protein product [Cylicocyclus nassatus]
MRIILTLLASSYVTASHISAEKFSLRVPDHVKQLNGQAPADYINNNHPFHKANPPRMTYEEFTSRLMNVKYLTIPKKSERAEELEVAEEIPESFDAREKWPHCDSIGLIRDQANCGSCWAVSAASAMSDRLCIQSNGRNKTILSDADLLACCGESCGYGCGGGYLLPAWKYAVNKGVCSGGLYKAKGCCKPYTFHPCGQHKDQPYYGECEESGKIITCRALCQFRYNKSYEEDKIYVSDAYWVADNEEAIQKEIMVRGPAQAAYVVYIDFLYYNGGVYVHKWGEQAGVHAVKIIGWGVDNGTKYWLVSNSWNSDWADEGYFKILRGENECGIEEMVAAGIMKL